MALPVELPPLQTVVSRRVAEAWRLRVDTRTAQPSALAVRYEVVAANGHRGHISHLLHAPAEIPIDIEPLTPVVIERDDRTAVLEGGFELTLHLDDVRFSGDYGGTLIVTFSHL
jgi:hypothetical protein